MKTINSLAELNDLAATGALRGLVQVPIELYHAGPGVSSSGLKDLLKSPAHYIAAKQGREDTASLRFGRLVHLRLLEPDIYKITTAVEPKADGRTKEGKAIKEAFAAQSAGKEILTEAESTLIEAMAKSAEQNKLASKIFGKGQAEVSVYWQDEATGILCKARADLLNGPVIIDLKTCYSAKEADFHKAVLSYQYHLSAAWYLQGFSTVADVKTFAWVALEKTAPHCFGFYAATQDLLDAGAADCRKALDILAECERTGHFPGYSESFVNLSLAGVV